MLTYLFARALRGIVIRQLLKRFRADPAVSSGAFVMTVTGVVGYGSFLGIAAVWFGDTRSDGPAARVHPLMHYASQSGLHFRASNQKYSNTKAPTTEVPLTSALKTISVMLYPCIKR
jgi:hypothetical protein